MEVALDGPSQLLLECQVQVQQLAQTLRPVEAGKEAASDFTNAARQLDQVPRAIVAMAPNPIQQTLLVPVQPPARRLNRGVEVGPGVGGLQDAQELFESWINPSLRWPAKSGWLRIGTFETPRGADD